MIVTSPRPGRLPQRRNLVDETIHQQTRAGIPFAKALDKVGIIPGIKVDAGAKPMAAHPNEKITEGLDGLRERLAEYVRTGCALLQVACRDHHWRRHPEPGLYRRERFDPRSLCGPVPGSRPCAHRRARSADGWRPHDGTLCRSHGTEPATVFARPRCPGRHCSKA